MTGKSNSRKKPKENPPSNSSSDPLAQFSQFSQRALQDTSEAIVSRKELTRLFLREIEKEIAEAVKMLKLLGDPWKHGDRTEYEFMRISLDKALTARKKERRERLLQSWKDLLDLNEKRLELAKENSALQLAGTSVRKKPRS